MSSAFISMEPVGKGRPRLGRGGRVYTPDKTRQAEHVIAAGWWAPVIAIEIPVEVRITAFMSRPVSHFLKGGSLSAAGRRSPVPMKRPDADNIAKLVLDALNGVAYRDDSQVVRFAVRKLWADHAEGPGVLVQVMALRPTPSSVSPAP